MDIRLGASWRAASSRARLNEPRRRLPANPTTRRTSFNACSAMPASSTEERESLDRKSTRLNSSHLVISYAVFCLKKKKKPRQSDQRHGDCYFYGRGDETVLDSDPASAGQTVQSEVDSTRDQS